MRMELHAVKINPDAFARGWDDVLTLRPLRRALRNALRAWLPPRRCDMCGEAGRDCLDLGGGIQTWPPSPSARRPAPRPAGS